MDPGHGGFAAICAAVFSSARQSLPDSGPNSIAAVVSLTVDQRPTGPVPSATFNPSNHRKRADNGESRRYIFQPEGEGRALCWRSWRCRPTLQFIGSRPTVGLWWLSWTGPLRGVSSGHADLQWKDGHRCRIALAGKYADRASAIAALAQRSRAFIDDWDIRRAERASPSSISSADPLPSHAGERICIADRARPRGAQFTCTLIRLGCACSALGMRSRHPLREFRRDLLGVEFLAEREGRGETGPARPRCGSIAAPRGRTGRSRLRSSAVSASTFRCSLSRGTPGRSA